MLKTKEGKKWVTPQLIVLVRGKPEEGVLLCKMSSYKARVIGPSTEYYDFYCNNKVEPYYQCNVCTDS
jgi:hypothetical protein